MLGLSHKIILHLFCQSELLAVCSLRLFWIKAFDVGLLRDTTVAPQPLGSRTVSTHCVCDLPGPRLPEGLLTLWGVVGWYVARLQGENQAHY